MAAPPPVPFRKVLALGVCAMAIGPNLALSAAYQLHYSGLHSWLAFAGAALLSMLVAIAISRLAARFNITPSILSFAKMTLPRSVTAVVAATLLLGYLIGPADGVLTEAIYLTSLASPLSRYADGPWVQCATVIVSAALIGACAYRGVDVSAKIATLLGISCIPLSIWITVASGSSFGFDIRPELSLTGVSSASVCQGVFVAMAFFIGFDGVGALASETAEPQRNVSRLLIWILLIAGITLSVGTLLQTPALLAHSAALDAGESPTKIMAIAGGLPSIAVAADVVLAMAGMASLIGWLNISAIIVSAAANEGFLPAILGRGHPRFGSPHCAVIFLTVLSVVIPTVMIIWTREAAIASSIYLTNVMVLLWLIPYGFICVAAVRRLDPRETRGAAVILSALGALAVIWVGGTALISPINRESAAINAIGACVIVAASAIVFKRGPAQSEPRSRHAP